MDLLQTGLWLPQLFYSEEDLDGEDDFALNAYFDLNGFSSTRLMNNGGSALVFLMYHIAIHTIYIIIRFLTSRQCHRQQNVQKHNIVQEIIIKNESWLIPVLGRNDKIFHTAVCAFGIVEYYQSHLQILTIQLGDMIGITISLTYLGLIVPIGIVCISKVLYSSIENKVIQTKKFNDTYGALIDEMNHEGLIALFWSVLIMLRWIFTLLILVVLRDFLSLQVSLLFIINIIWHSLLLLGKPFLQSHKNYISSFNESLISLYLYFMITLTDINKASYLRETLALCLLSIVIFAIAINFIIALVIIFKGLKQSNACRKQVVMARKYPLNSKIIAMGQVKKLTSQQLQLQPEELQVEDFEDPENLKQIVEKMEEQKTNKKRTSRKKLKKKQSKFQVADTQLESSVSISEFLDVKEQPHKKEKGRIDRRFLPYENSKILQQQSYAY
ncbi:hypothetical protein FGO68_gene11103 [Halteria grandinella]|uniref:TRP C-terminal domain-containing protein n=1 Tax=Halteria grandinella TaxID=5974 RepID=A0A8J8P4K2_HALGN|nr:hypothetical protein FGO68_gene11103 [Halteria grandinella]